MVANDGAGNRRSQVLQQSNRAKLEARGERALASLYHLASPSYPRDFGPYADDFDSWLGEEATRAIEFANGEPGSFADAPAPIVAMFGKLYSYGRGGRTVAPEGLIEERGGGAFRLNSDALLGLGAAELTAAVLVIESYADEVEAWNHGVPESWAYETASRAEFDRDEARGILGDARKALKAIFADVRKVRAAGVETPAICQTLAADVRGIRREMREAFATLAKLAGVQALDGVAA